MTLIHCPIFKGYTESPHKNALYISDHTYTYEELEIEVEKKHAALIHLGIKEGSRVAIFSDDYATIIPLLFTLFRIGATALILNPKTPPSSLKTLVKKTHCSHIFHTEILDNMNAYNGIKIFSYNNLFSTKRIQKTLLSTQQYATLMMTSGSTGSPKYVLHSLGNHYYSALGSIKNLDITPASHYLLSLPLYHVSGLSILFRCFMQGASLHVRNKNHTLLETIAQSKITHLSLVHTQLSQLIKNEKCIEQLKQCQAILLGGSSLPRKLLNLASKLNLPIYTTYGLTEMSSQVTCAKYSKKNEIEASNHPNHSGKIMEYRDLQISKNNEILVRGKTLFKGYFDQNLCTLTLNHDGWFKTGDLGFLNKNDELIVTGRQDNMFISGGENIHPEEIESTLLNIEHICECIVVPIRDKEFGHRPVAIIQKQCSDITTQDIRTQLKETLPSYKLPDHILSWPKKSSNISLKVNRQSLKSYAEKMINHKER